MSLANVFSNYSDLWYTPPEWLEWVENTIGADYFDPCPQDWDEKLDFCGLDELWPSRFYVNHPGARGSSQPWWSKATDELIGHGLDGAFVWCAFSHEQLRHLYPSPFHMPGWLVMPRDRIGFYWGGPDMIVNEKAVENGAEPKWRLHGDQAKTPGNWTVFWTNKPPAPTPTPCVIERTC